MAQVFRSIGVEHLRPIAPPPQEVPPRWRRVAEGLRHSKSRDAEAIHHHNDVSNTFYERAEFDALYGGDAYRAAKARYDPDSRLLDLYAKAVQRR